MNIRASLALLALGTAAAVGGFSAYRYWQAEPAAPPAEVRPDLQFQDLDGKVRKLSEWDGRLLLLNFWATWCTPCLKEIPLLVQAQQTHAAHGLQVVGIAMDQVEPVTRFRERFAINYPLLVGEADVVTAMDALGDTLGALPFTVVIARDGRILERIWGDLSGEELDALLKKHL